MPTMTKSDKARVLITALSAVVLVGLALLLSRQVFDFGGLAFEILTYVLSVVALILAVLSVMNGIRQGRVMKSIVKDVHAELVQMASLNDKIEQGIREDQEVNKIVTDILSKYGLDKDDRLHKQVTRRTHRHIKKHGL